MHVCGDPEGFVREREMIKAITFDLWDTVIHDESDEPKRQAQGLRSKRDERRHLVWDALQREAPISHPTVASAYEVADAAFDKVWHDHYITWTVAERLRVLLQGLGRHLPDQAFAEVVKRHEEMEGEVIPDPVADMPGAITELAGRYKIAVVSDALVSPGRVLRQILQSYGVQHHFGGFAFSDEVGHSKPHRAMFGSAAQQLGVEISEMLHIGDRDHNDIKGSHAVGMKAILFTARRSADRETTSADAICEQAKDLPAIVDRLVASAV